MTSIFSKIINREIPSTFLFEDDKVIVIRDIQPKAKTHLLIIPKKEIPTINDLQWEDAELVAHMFFVAQRITKNLGISEWYKIQFNVWEKWGQVIFHVHMHILSDM